MAFRFRRSMKLGKGIRLNVSKKGVGMSIGKRGLRQSIHSTGSRTGTIGIPGTGLSYVNQKRISNKTKSTKGTSSNSMQGIPKENATVVEEYEKYIETITHLHLYEPIPRNWKEIKNIQAPFEPGQPGPLEVEARLEYNAYSPNMLEKFIKPLQNKKLKQLEEKVRTAQVDDVNNYQEWETLHCLAESVLQGTPEAYEQVIQENQAFDDARQRGMLVRVVDATMIEIDLQISPNKVVPNRTLTLTKTGKVSRRKMGKTAYYAIMKNFVCSYVLSVARETFASLPIEKILIHVNEHALNTATGHRKKKVLLSTIIDKKTLNQLNFECIVPADAMGNFEHHMHHLKTKGFRSVKRITIPSNKTS